MVPFPVLQTRCVGKWKYPTKVYFFLLNNFYLTKQYILRILSLFRTKGTLNWRTLFLMIKRSICSTSGPCWLFSLYDVTLLNPFTHQMLVPIPYALELWLVTGIGIIPMELKKVLLFEVLSVCGEGRLLIRISIKGTYAKHIVIKFKYNDARPSPYASSPPSSVIVWTNEVLISKWAFAS